MERMRLLVNGIYLLFMRYMPYHIVKKNMKGGCQIADDKIEELENEIVNRYIGSKVSEEREAARFIQRYGLWNVFPYKFCFNYLLKAAVLVRYDKKEKMFYVNRNGRRLYFKQKTLKEVVNYYNTILCEQDRNSPHCYNNIMGGQYFFDCGAAEGFLALDVIDKFEKIVIFEADQEWMKALTKTFEPYRHKVQIVNCLLTDKKENGKISIDSFVEEQQIDMAGSLYIKMDVEGYESKVIEGAKESIGKAKKLQMAVCTYHKQHDAETILSQVKKIGDYTRLEYSKGYMILFYAEDNEMPFLRKGILHIEKNSGC